MNEKPIENRGEIIIYRAEDNTVQLDVRMENETVWLNLNQMAMLFDRDKSVISRHIRDVYKECELSKEATVAKNATVQIEGGRAIVRQMDYYNLDVIISVGYRVKSQRGVQFRQWANKILKDYLVKGYAINEKLRREQLSDLRQLVQIVGRTVQSKAVESEDCYDCVLTAEITGNTFIGNSEGLACRYWSDRTGINYTRTFIKESASNSVVYSGNSGLCPKESGKGMLIGDGSSYTQRSVGGINVYEYTGTLFRGFPTLTGMQNFWYNCGIAGGSDTMLKWVLNTTLQTYLQSFGYYMMAHDRVTDNGSYFDLCAATLGSPIQVQGATGTVTAKII